MTSQLADVEYTPETNVIPIRSGGMNIVTIFGKSSETEVDEYIPIPDQTIARYADNAARLAELTTTDEGEVIAEIPGFQGVWSSADNAADALAELREVVVDWVTIKLLRRDTDIPLSGGIDLNIVR